MPVCPINGEVFACNAQRIYLLAKILLFCHSHFDFDLFLWLHSTVFTPLLSFPLMLPHFKSPKDSPATVAYSLNIKQVPITLSHYIFSSSASVPLTVHATVPALLLNMCIILINNKKVRRTLESFHIFSKLNCYHNNCLCNRTPAWKEMLVERLWVKY